MRMPNSYSCTRTTCVVAGTLSPPVERPSSVAMMTTAQSNSTPSTPKTVGAIDRDVASLFSDISAISSWKPAITLTARLEAIDRPSTVPGRPLVPRHIEGRSALLDRRCRAYGQTIAVDGRADRPRPVSRKSRRYMMGCLRMSPARDRCVGGVGRRISDRRRSAGRDGSIRAGDRRAQPRRGLRPRHRGRCRRFDASLASPRPRSPARRRAHASQWGRRPRCRATAVCHGRPRRARSCTRIRRRSPARRRPCAWLWGRHRRRPARCGDR